jgi:hypothetical protein
MTVDLRGAAYAASRISSMLKGNTKQFGWLQAAATKRSSLSVTSANLQPSEFVCRKSVAKALSPILCTVQFTGQNEKL